MIKSNKILCIVGAILIAFVGLFGIIFATQDDRVVKADTSSYSFTGSSLLIPYVPFTGQGSFANPVINTNSYATNKTLSISLDMLSSNQLVIHYRDLDLNNGNIPVNSVTLNYSNISDYSYLGYSNNISGQYFNFGVRVQSGFNNVIDRVYIGSYSPEFGQNRLGATNIIYYDSNNLECRIFIPYYSSYVEPGTLVTPRTYYFASLSDNQYFQAGYDNGYDVGNSAGYNTGYSAGYNVGNSAGYNTGYNAGVENANDYTFLGLIGATIDAPISAFTSFFDFELLGVNLKDFFFAILTFALVIVIIRFALAR